MAGKKKNTPKTGKVLPPKEEKLSGDVHVVQAIIAHLSERPDLMLDAIEKHDKGFVKRMNKRMEEREERLHLSKFKYSERRAYTVLVIIAIGALCCPFIIVYLAVTGMPPSFFLIIGLAIFFAIAQSGPSGFIHIAKGIKQLLARGRNDNDN